MAYRRRRSTYRRRRPMRRKRYTRKRRYGRKRTYRRTRAPMRRRLRTTALLRGSMKYNKMRLLGPYMDPFHSGNNPRIPDGQAQRSLGRKSVNSQQITKVSSSDPLLIYLWPGMGSGLQYGETLPETYPKNSFDLFYNHNTSVTPSAIQLNQRVAQWRLVSAGLRLKLVNSTDDNEGWFEAVRVNLPSTTDKIVFDVDNSNVAGEIGRLLDAGNLPFGVNGPANMANDPTYTTDTLKNIYKHAFFLSPSGKDHHFIDLEENIDVGSGDMRFILDDRNQINHWYDDSYDMVVIKIHGNGSSGTTPATKLQATSVHNREYVYHADATEYNFMTQTQYVASETIKTTSRRKTFSLPQGSVNSTSYYLRHANYFR